MSVSHLKVTPETVYVETDTGVETQTENVYFLDGYGDVPFINLSGSLGLSQRALLDSTVKTSDKIVTIGRTENSATITFDFAGGAVTHSNLDLYAAGPGKDSVLDLAMDQGTTTEGKPKYLASQNIEYLRSGNPVTFDLLARNIPYYFEDGAGYLPVQTFAGLVFSEHNIYLISNGQSLFIDGAWFSNDGEMGKQFYSVTPSGVRSQEMADFSYQELLLALDFQYGLKESHDITDFASYIPAVKGLKEKLTSTDALVADQGLYQLCSGALCDYHSYLQAASAYLGKDQLASAKDATLCSPNYSEYQLIRYAFFTARKKIVSALSGGTKTAFDSYEEYTNPDGQTATAYVTFDEFAMPTQDYYTTPATKDATDTYGIIEYAQSQIFRTNSPVTKVVLDLSNNGGGSINAGLYTAGWFLPYGILNDRDSLSHEQGSFTYASDVNMDGAYDETDRLSSLQLYCLISPASFSCSNFVSSIFKDSDQVRLLGRHTSGGGGLVQHLSMADGTLFATSGNRVICSGHNGTFASIDEGIDVDFSLDSYLDFYNHTALTSKFASLLSAASL
jgi:hypothetical protein